MPAGARSRSVRPTERPPPRHDARNQPGSSHPFRPSRVSGPAVRETMRGSTAAYPYQLMATRRVSAQTRSHCGGIGLAHVTPIHTGGDCRTGSES